jgi:hypothetical protein
MTAKLFALTAVVLAVVVQAAAAQSPTGTTGDREKMPGAVATVDVSQLPGDIRRIERNFRRSEIRSERDGLNLRYFVEVFAKAPSIVLFTPEDNLAYGPVPYGAPTHSEMLNMITPRYHRNHGGVDLLHPRSSSKKK